MFFGGFFVGIQQRSSISFEKNKFFTLYETFLCDSCFRQLQTMFKNPFEVITTWRSMYNYSLTSTNGYKMFAKPYFSLLKVKRLNPYRASLVSVSV